MPNFALCSHVVAADTSSGPTSPERRCRRIAAIVAPEFRVALADIESSTRGSQAAAFARQVAMYLAHVGFGLGFVEIGKCFGRDRTTIAHACRVVEDRRDDVWFDSRMAELELACCATECGVR